MATFNETQVIIADLKEICDIPKLKFGKGGSLNHPRQYILASTEDNVYCFDVLWAPTEFDTKRMMVEVGNEWQLIPSNENIMLAYDIMDWLRNELG
jgi:hypothetical protein